MKTNLTLQEALQKANPVLRGKMERSVELIRKAERLSLMYDADDGFFLAFSGGKDSQALYHITELSGCHFKAHFSPTTVDPPQLIKFIKRNYPETEFGRVEKNIYDLAVEKRILPTQRVRWCCAEFKEMAGAGKVTLIGIRHAESARRAKRNEVEVSNRKFSGNFEQFTEWQEEKIRKKYKNLNQDQFSYDKEQEVRCISGKDSILVSPIIDWTESDVWEFLNSVMEVPHCELYDQGYHRIGCILCPMSSYNQKIKECQDFPYVKKKWIGAIKAIRQGGGVSQDKPIRVSKLRHGGASSETAVNGRKFKEGYLWWGIREDNSTDCIHHEGNSGKMLGRNISKRGIRATQTSTREVRNGLLPGGGRLGGGNPEGSQEVCEKTKAYGKQVDYQKPTPIPNEELENQIAENIFDWWLSGVSYEQWYANKFLQQKINFEEDGNDSE